MYWLLGHLLAFLDMGMGVSQNAGVEGTLVTATLIHSYMISWPHCLREVPIHPIVASVFEQHRTGTREKTSGGKDHFG